MEAQEARIHNQNIEMKHINSAIALSQLNMNTPNFNQTIEAALVAFMKQHQRHLPINLHQLAIQAIEKPLLKLIMQQAENNQSKAAKMLGLNRATLHKKLIEYQLLDTLL